MRMKNLRLNLQVQIDGPTTARLPLSNENSRVTVIAENKCDERDWVGNIDLDRWRQLAEAVLRAEGVAIGELNLVFVGENIMAGLNTEYMEGDGSTDVLAFPIDGLTSDTNFVPILLGDVIVCPAVARRYAVGRDIPIDDELAQLVVHGVLHVLGHDHVASGETRLMKERERALLAAYYEL